MEKTLKTILLLFLHHKDNILNPFFKKSIIFEVFFHFHFIFIYYKEMYGTWTSTEEYVLWTTLNVNNEEKKN